MILIYLITFILIILFLYNRHKFILFYSIANILFQTYLCLKFSAPALTVLFFINFIILTFSIHDYKMWFRSNPMKICFVIIFLSLTISLFASINSFLSNFPNYFMTLVSYLLIFICYNEIKSVKDVHYIFKSFTIICTIFVLYGIVEYIMQDNIFLNYINTLASEKDLIGKTCYKMDYFNSTEVRFGTVRCYSFMPISISWGGLCALYFYFLILFKKNIVKITGFYSFTFIVAATIFCIYTTGSRTPYVYFMIILLSFLLSKSNKRGRIISIVCILIIYILVSNYFSDILTSYSSKSNVNGSSLNMRIEQTLSVEKVISKSPFFGLGIKGYNSAFQENSDILGAESVWLQDLISCGIVGVILKIIFYIMLVITIYKNTPKAYRINSLFIVIGWIIFQTFSTSPGLTESYFMLFISVILKIWKIQFNHNCINKKNVVLKS